MYLGKKSLAADRSRADGTSHGEKNQASSFGIIDPVLECLSYLARSYERPSSPVILKAGLALDENGWLPFHQAEAALEQIGMRAIQRHASVSKLQRMQWPVLIELIDKRCAVLIEAKGQDFLLFIPGSEQPFWVNQAEISSTFSGNIVLIEADPSRDREGERPWQKAARIHWFWSEFSKVRHSFVHVALAAAVINLLALALPLFTMNVYDRIIPNKTVSSLWVLAIGVIFALSLEFMLRIARARVIDEVGGDLDARLSQKIFEKVMNIPLLAKEGSTGALARRVSEYENVRDFFASTTIVLVVDMMFLLVFLAVITIIGGWLVMVPIAGMALMLLAGMLLQKEMGQVSLDAQADASLQHSVLVEAISGQETLKAACAESRMLGRWQRYARMSAVTQRRLRGLASIAINMASLCQQMISVGLVVGGFYLFNAGSISMGAIIAVVMLAGRSLAPVGQFAFLMTRARQAMSTMHSLQELSQAEDERTMAARTVLPSIGKGVVEFNHVNFIYPNASKNSLSDIRLIIQPGERIGMIGRVASGKSTFGRLLCGLYPPSEGTILIDGLDSRQHHPHQIRGAFRYVGQDADLFSGTVRDNLVLGSVDDDDERLLDAVRRAGADIFISRDAAGFDLAIGEKGSRLSGGQRSFLVLARALVEPCKLLFLDEPTGAMDTQTERWFIEHLKTALAPDQTLIVSTHRNAMLDIVDRLIVIDKGRIIADGPKSDVINALTEADRSAGQ